MLFKKARDIGFFVLYGEMLGFCLCDSMEFFMTLDHWWSQQSALPTTFQDKNVINIRHFDIDIRQNGINMRVWA